MNLECEGKLVEFQPRQNRVSGAEGLGYTDSVNDNPGRKNTMFDDESDLGKNRSPAPDAAPEDNPEPDALKDADVTSGTVGTKEVNPTRKGEAKEASDTTPQDAGTL